MVLGLDKIFGVNRANAEIPRSGRNDTSKEDLFAAIPLGFSFQNHGVEAVADMEAGVLVELDRWAVRLGYGEGDGGRSDPGETAHHVAEKDLAQVAAAMRWCNAELSDVGDVRGDA